MQSSVGDHGFHLAQVAPQFYFQGGNQSPALQHHQPKRACDAARRGRWAAKQDEAARILAATTPPQNAMAPSFIPQQPFMNIAAPIFIPQGPDAATPSRLQVALQQKLQRAEDACRVLETRLEAALAENQQLKVTAASAQEQLASAAEEIKKLKGASGPSQPGVQQAVPLQESRWHKQNISPAAAFKVPAGWKMRECISGGAAGRKGLVLEDCDRTELTPKESAALELTKELSLKVSAHEITDESMRTRAVLYGLDVGKQGNQRTHPVTKEKVRLPVSTQPRAHNGTRHACLECVGGGTLVLRPH